MNNIEEDLRAKLLTKLQLVNESIENCKKSLDSLSKDREDIQKELKERGYLK